MSITRIPKLKASGKLFSQRVFETPNPINLMCKLDFYALLTRIINAIFDDAIKSNWEKYIAMFRDQQFEVYENKRVDQTLVVAGQDKREIHVLNRTLARSRVDIKEIITNVRDRRFEFEVGIRERGILVEVAQRTIEAFNQTYSIVIARIMTLTLKRLIGGEN
ncbi:hypothetical protein BDZ45DRAFT_697492 [Acephala macrosclerotiorum]|nr:hypothetical protein BDZ45DRAFT_697492 [Acephala macrosclerotiorum]